MFTKLKNLLAARKRMKCAKSDAAAIAKFTEPFIQLITPLVSVGLYKRVPTWSLANHDLTNFLAYMGGVLDMADFLLKKNSSKARDDTLGIYISFCWYVEASFDGLPNVDQFIKLTTNFIYHTLNNNSEIAGLPWMLGNDYEFYQKLGADDFFNFLSGKAGYFPIGLFKLGVFGGARNLEHKISPNIKTTTLAHTPSENNIEKMPTCSVNRIFLIGEVVTEPEVRYLESGEPVLTYILATDGLWDEMDGKLSEAKEYHKIKQFEVNSEFKLKKPRVGDQVFIKGSTHTFKEIDDKGATIFPTFIHTSEMKVLVVKDDQELCYYFEF